MTLEDVRWLRCYTLIAEAANEAPQGPECMLDTIEAVGGCDVIARIAVKEIGGTLDFYLSKLQTFVAQNRSRKCGNPCDCSFELKAPHTA